MKIRNLVVLMITVALATLSVSAQVTITDNSNQSLMISRFGTVVKFRNRFNRRFEPDHTYKICTCSTTPRCIEPNLIGTATATLKVEFPQSGTRLRSNESLKAVATVKLGRVTLTRRLEWLAGSSVIYVVDTVAADSTNVCSIEERGVVLSDSCSMPPPSQTAVAQVRCPPPPAWTATWLRVLQTWNGHIRSFSINLAREAPVEP